MKLKSKTRDRLTRLSIYLDSLPEDYREFEMRTYFDRQRDDYDHVLERKYARKNGGVASCGTSACAVGHGPSAGIPVPKRFITKNWGTWEIDWSEYAEIFTDGSTAHFSWMFGANWSEIDNHHYGAAARIKYVLMGLPIPALYESGMHHPTLEEVALYQQFCKRPTLIEETV